MAGTWRERFGRRRVRWIAAGFALACLAGIVAVVLLRWRELRRGTEDGQTVPALVDTGEVEVSGLAAPVVVQGDGALGGGETLLIRLSEGQPGFQAASPLPVAGGELLSGEETARILARLPALPAEPEDEVEFRRPEDSPPAPRPGRTVEEEFPPAAPAVPVEVETGPLEVLRYAPEGPIPLAPFVNVTFNQPMVPLATLGALAAEEVPVRLDPALPGTWKWLGTQTLSFEYDSDQIDRLPMATEYVVTVPAGTRSATGGALAREVRWSFSTPPPRLTASLPSSSPQPLSPLFLAAFDQRIHPQAVLGTIRVTAGGREVGIKLASADQVAADKEAARLSKEAGDGRWLAFVVEEPLPAEASVTVTVGPGTPSAEGPLVTQEAQSYGFSTYAPLRIARYGCSWYGEECPPLTPFFVEFNNPLDVEAYQEEMLHIEPALPGATVDVAGNTITIRGASRGRTTYTLVVDGSLPDAFGQTLGKEARLSIKVGSAEPVLMGPEGNLVTLDPASKAPALTVYAVNHNRLRVRAYQVQPSDWPAFKSYLQNFYQDNPPDPPGRLALDKAVPLEAEADALTEANIDLSPALEGGLGQLVVVVQPDGWKAGGDRSWNVIQVWVQVTQIGLDAFVDHSEMVAWTTALQDGAPLAGATLETAAGKPLAQTGGDGTARFDLPGEGIPLLVARQGRDTAILPQSPYAWGEDAWAPRPVSDELRWVVFDDRAMYRPGEEVHVKGWLRRVGGREDGDVGLPGSSVGPLAYQVVDPQGNQLLAGEAQVNALGGFDLAFTLPESTNLGYASLRLQAQGSLSGLVGQEWQHSFQVQEFRRPEFEVTARAESAGPHFAGGSATLAVQASYYAGGPLPNAEVSWLVSSSPGSYSPPNWPDFSFGTWTPWWIWERAYSWPPEGQVDVETFSGVTDASGTHYLQLDFGQEGEPRPVSVKAEATVIDVNRQAWAAATTLLVHPAELYVGLRCDQAFVERGQPLEVQLIVTDLGGNPEADRPIQVRAARLEWKSARGDWRQEEVDVQECTVGSTATPVSCTFTTDVGGEYRITAAVVDALGRRNQSQITRWVSGGQQPPARKVEQEPLTLIPDKESYRPGDVAHILVQPPFAPAEGLLTVSRSGLVSTERFRIEEGTATLEVPIDERQVPNLHVQVDLVGAAPRTDDRGEPLAGAPPRPAYATGQVSLSIPPLQRTLALQVTPRQVELEPGGETTLDLFLADAAGAPVPDAELAVVVVDEAILALTGYELVDPVAAFYGSRPADLSSRYGRDSILLASPEALAGAAGSRDVLETVVVEQEVAAYGTPSPAALPPAEGAGAAPPGAEPIRVRADFNPLATFAPQVRTGADGRAQVAVTLPDNLTRYRVMVVAVAGGSRFGSAEANLVARLPLMIRPSAPRFLNFGDRLELPIVLQNQTDQPLTVDVALRASNLELAAGGVEAEGRPPVVTEGRPPVAAEGRRVVVPARDRVEVRFPAAAHRAGTARFQVAAVSGTFADAATVELPVYTPATTEAFATYGVVDEGAVAQPVAAPGDSVYPQFGGLEITTSSTALQALTDAVLYLVSYRYECSEQLASRILAVASLRDLLEAFSAEGLPSAADMEAAVVRDIERLKGLQNGDGGFPSWRRGQDSIPFNTIHVAHALHWAEQMDFAVPPDMRARALDYLREIEGHYPDWYDQSTRQALSAYALYVRHLLGDGDPDKARKLVDQAGVPELSLEAAAWLWQTLSGDPASAAQVEALRRLIASRAVETAGAANFSTSYGDQAYLLLHSDRRTDAIVLEALIAGDPASDLVPKVVNGLLAHRKQGRWDNTQENVFVLLALRHYFSVYEAETPDFVARIWLGDAYVGEHAYRGRTADRHASAVPMSYLASIGRAQDLVLNKEGAGRLYYRLGLRYAPTDLALEPVDRGFVVQRSYEAVDDPGDVARDADGTWRIRAGARVRVRLSLVADSRRYHVALVDPLPAGLEIVNPALSVSGAVPQDPNSPDYRVGWWWWGTWYEHQNMRDDRAEAFATLLWDGVYGYTYVARATTPGRFVAPPARAEEMYSPDVFGRSGSDWVVVE